MKISLNKKAFVIFLYFLGINSFVAQNFQESKDCNLQAKNAIWLRELKNEQNISKKIIKIQGKIKSDTIYKSAKPKNLIIRDGGSINYDSIDTKGNNCGIKILFILMYGGKESLILDLNSNPEYQIIVDSINESNVTIMELDPQQGSSMFGFQGSSGAIYLQSKNRELIKLIKKYSKKKVSKQ